jgi:hypothetical protein
VRFGATVAAALVCLVGCSSNVPWDVADGEELRFRRSAKECRMLTLDADGYQGPITFDQCMNNRGFRRQGPIKRLWRSF